MVVPRNRFRDGLFRLLAGLTFVVAIGLLILSVVDDLSFSSERIGVFIEETEQGIVIDGVDPGLPADRAGVQDGDVVVAIEGNDVSSLEDVGRLFDEHHSPGESLNVTILRDGQELALELTPGVTPDITGLIAQIVLVIAYLGIAILASAYRKKDVRARVLMVFTALIAVELAIPAGYTFSLPTIYAMLLFWMATTGIQFAMELHLVSLIPRRLPFLQRHPNAVYGIYAIGILVSLAMIGLAVHDWFIAGLEFSPRLGVVESAVMVGWAVIVASVLSFQVWRADSARNRNQALLVLIGLIPWVIYVFVTSFWSGWVMLEESWAEPIENVVLLIFPAAVFVAIFRYGLFDIEHIVRRGLVYGVISALILILLYTLLTTALPWISGHVGANMANWVITASALIVGILFRPLRNSIERMVERGFFPERRALRNRLIGIASSLSGQDNMHELVEQMAADTRKALGLTWAAVVAIEGPGRGLNSAFSEGIGPRQQNDLVSLLNTDSRAFQMLAQMRRPVTVRRLERRQSDMARALARVGAEVLVPLYFQRRMIGILCLASKRSGELFVREELELLDLFSHQIATSLENLRLFQDATYEELTGLLRREAVLRQLQAETARAVRNATPLAVFMMDLDHFKAVNDAHGHLFGDRILEEVARSMRDRIRAVDALGRYGGEEFLLVLPDTDLEGARLLADQLRQAVSELRFQVPDGDDEVQVTMSIGIAVASARQTDSAEMERELLEHADAAVYEAKNQGRNRVVLHATEE